MALGSQLDAGNIPVPVIDGPGQLHALFSALTEKRQRNHADLYCCTWWLWLTCRRRSCWQEKRGTTEARRQLQLKMCSRRRSSSNRARLMRVLAGGWMGSR